MAKVLSNALVLERVLALKTGVKIIISFFIKIKMSFLGRIKNTF